MSLKTPAAAVNSLKRLQESKASKSCRAHKQQKKRPFVVFFFAMWLLAVCMSVSVCVWFVETGRMRDAVFPSLLCRLV